MKRSAATFAFAIVQIGLLSPTASALAADCLTADQLGAPGPYASGSYSFPPNGGQMNIVMGSYKTPTGQLEFGTPSLLSNTACSSAAGILLSTNGSNLYLEVTAPQQITNIIVSFCDGAGQNNISARLLGIDYTGDAKAANGISLPGPLGSAAAQVTVTPTSGGMSFAADLKVHGDPMSQLIFGGAETYISSICVE